MANASFHAKITADARQFIQQVEQANQALQELTKATQESQSGRSGRAGKSAEAQKRKEQKVTHKEAEQALDDLHKEEMQNIKRENIARLAATKQQKDAIKKARQADRLEGPVREDQDPGVQQGFKDQAKLITGAQRLTAQTKQQADIQKQVAQQKNKLAAQTKKQVIDEQKRVALQQKLVQEGKLAFGPLREQESTTEGLLQSQRERNRLLKEERAAAQAIAKAQKANVSLVGPENLAASQEQKILKQKKLQADVDRQVVKEKQRIAAENKKAIVLEKKLNDSKKRALGPVQEGVRGAKQLNNLADQYNQTLRDQKATVQAIASANRAQSEAMITGRYALYDMANAYRGVLDVASRVTKELVMTVQKAAEFETAFTSVERAATLEKGSEQFNEIRDSLIDLSREIPVAFDEISEIATLGAQMGIATEDLSAFTEQISAFATVTGNTVDDTAEKFGRLSSLANVPSEEFENLASAVIFAGFNAVATEKEILKMSESIAGAATNAGYSAQQIVGLSTALSSLAIPPEQARGVILRLFGDIQRAVDGSSGKIDEFAAVMGTTSEAAKDLFNTNPEQFFSSFVGGLSEVENLTSVLDELGIVETREINVLQRLSGNMDVYNKSISDAANSYQEGSALGEAFADTQDNLDAKIQRLINAFTAFQAAAAGPLADALGALIDLALPLLESFTKLAETPIGGFLLALATAVAGATAAFAGINFVMNIATAQILAMRTALAKMGEMQGQNILSTTGLSGTLKMLLAQVNGTTFAVTMLDGSLKFLTTSEMEAAVAAKTLSAANKEAAISAAAAARSTRGLSVALKAIPFVGIISTVALLGTALLDATGAFNLFNSEADEADKLKEIGEAGVVAAGGINAFREALQRDSEGDKVVRLGNLEFAQGKVNTALETGIELLGEYASLSSGGESTDNALVEAKAEEYTNLLKQSLVEPIGDQETSFFENLSGLSSSDRQAVEDLGLDISDIIDKEMSESGSGLSFVNNIAENLPKALSQIVEPTQDEISGAFSFAGMGLDELVSEIEQRFGPQIANVIQKSFEDADTVEEIVQKISNLQNLDLDFFVEGAGNVSAINTEVQNSILVQEEYKNSLDGTAESVAGLSDQIKDYLENANSELIANQNLESSFRKLAEGMINTTGSMTGLDDGSIKNRENFEDFITSAFELAEVLGEDASFAIQQATGYAAVLAGEGVDVTDMISQIAAVASAKLPGVAADFGIVVDALNEGISDEAITSFVRAAFAMELAAAKTKAEYFALQAQIRSTISFIEDINFDFGVNRLTPSIKDSTSALEKMEDQIQKTFGFFDRLFSTNDALRTLATGLEENGRSFDAWSQTGQENTQNIIDVIDALATKAGGDTQRFANSLMSLRTVLANMGVGERGLRFVDSALEQLGVTGVASTNEMKNLNEVLSQTGDSADEIKSVAEAVEAIAGSARSGLDAAFAEARAIDEITLALLDYEEAQQDAAQAIKDFGEDIADAKEEIDDAKQAIEEANAAIGELTADRSKLEYQLEVALRYGDLLRAEQIRADIASIDADIAGEQGKISDSNKDIAGAQNDIANAEQGIIDVRTKSTRETIAATRALEDLASKYVDTTAHMLANAGQGADLNGIIDDQVEAFRNNAIQMGATETEADNLAKILREELIKSMDEIPEDIETEIKAETAQALSDIEYFVNRANDRLADVEREIVTTHKVVTSYSGNFKGYNVGSSGFTGFSAGGFVSGPGGSTADKIPAMLSDGEYVIQANAVDKYGVPFLNALNQSMVRANPVMSGGGASAGGSSIMQLSPEDRALLRAAMERPINLYTDNATIARSANDGNTLLAQRGLN